MERFYFFFLILFLWGNASGIGVWDGRPAQDWRRGGFKSLEDPPSLFPSPSSTPPKCAYRRRPSPFNSVSSHLKPQGPTYGPGYWSGQFNKPVPQSQGDSLYQQDNFGVIDSSKRLSSQTSPQNLQTQYAPASNPVATSQSSASAFKSPQQGSYGVSSSWHALQGQSIPLASHSRLQTQALRLLPPSQSLASAPKLPPQQGSYGIQSGNFALWRQTSPSASGSTLQTQTSSLATPSQSLESTWLASQRQRIPSFPQSIFETSSLVAPSQSSASASDSSRQGSYGVASSFYTSHGQSISSDTHPTLENQAPRPVTSSQILASGSKPPQQGNYVVPSGWYDASMEQSNPSASQLSQYAPAFKTQSSRLMPPASKGLANLFPSISQSSPDQTVPVFSAQLQTAETRNAAEIGPPSLYTPLQGQDVQASWFDALNQVPAVQTQSSYKPVFQSQGLENRYNFPPQTWVRADPSGLAQWYRVTNAGLEPVQTIEPLFPFQSLEVLYNQAALGNTPPVSQSPNSPVSFGFASQNRGTQTSTQALSPLNPTMLQVGQSPWP